MKFTCKKTENCFADSQTYEYVLPVSGEALLGRLAGWETRRNEKLRRPTFSADRGGVNVKGTPETRCGSAIPRTAHRRRRQNLRNG